MSSNNVPANEIIELDKDLLKNFSNVVSNAATIAYDISESTMLFGALMFIMLAIIFYYYKEYISKQNLIRFIIISLITVLIGHVRKILTGQGTEFVLYVILFIFVYSFINR